MGYRMQQLSCNGFMLKKANEKKALSEIKKLTRAGVHFCWADENYKKAKTLEEALDAWRWGLERDSEGNIFVLSFEGEKLGDDPILLSAIAPYVEDGGELEMQGEDGDRWKWVFHKGKLRELSGTTVYEPL
jgi:hypothetical protein